jgi:hypothetical protein
VVARLREEQDLYFADSDLLSPTQWEKRSLAIKFAENMGRLVSPLL